MITAYCDQCGAPDAEWRVSVHFLDVTTPYENGDDGYRYRAAHEMDFDFCGACWKKFQGSLPEAEVQRHLNISRYE